MLHERIKLLARVDSSYSLLQVFPSSSRIILIIIVNFHDLQSDRSDALIVLSAGDTNVYLTSAEIEVSGIEVRQRDQPKSFISAAWDLDSLFARVSTVLAYWI